MLVYLIAIFACLVVIYREESLLSQYPRRSGKGSRRYNNIMGDVISEDTSSSDNKHSENQSEENSADDNILTREFSRVEDFNLSLQEYAICNGEVRSPVMLDKALALMLSDKSATFSVLLNMLKRITANIEVQHLAALKSLFIQCESESYLLDLEIYKLVDNSEACIERTDFLDFLSHHIQVRSKVAL